jgi:long-chain acyl-CoA synthetase
MKRDKLTLSILLLALGLEQTANAFMLPLGGHLKQTPASALQRLVHHTLPSLLSPAIAPRRSTTRPDDMVGTTSATSTPASSSSTSNKGVNRHDDPPAVIDSHWTQGNPIAQLRRGDIPTFTWPHPTSSSSSSGENLPPVDKAALADAIASPTLVKSVPAIWDILAEHCGPHLMLTDPSHPLSSSSSLALTFAQAHLLIHQAAAGFHALGFRKGDHLAFFSENSARWLVTEQGASHNGCPTAVRGAAAPVEELQFIYNHADCKAVVLQDVALLRKLHAAGGLSSSLHGPPRLVVILRPPENTKGAAAADDLSSVAAELGLASTTLISIEELLALGAKHLPHFLPPDLTPSDLHTLVFTSGTTGRPKGVMLSHSNLLHQIRHIDLGLNPGPGDVILSLLPCWHIFERSSELFALAQGASLVYSSVRAFKSDLQTYRPHFLIVVPRLLENVHKSIKEKLAAGPPARRKLVAFLSLLSLLYTRALKRALGLVVRRPPSSQQQQQQQQKKKLHLRSFLTPLLRLTSRPLAVLLTFLLFPFAQLSDLIVFKKVRSALGGRQKLVISGGSALAKYLEEFYDSAGIPVVSGYGLTETSPVIAVRRAGRRRNLVDGGVVGLPPQEVELQVRDVETGVVLQRQQQGKAGVVFTRGPQVMRGYYKDSVSTQEAIDANGWFDTGDLGFINPDTGDLVLTGRAKDVIVLSNGENIEPQPIEDAVVERCAVIEQCMIVGQDQRQLSALVVVNPLELAARGWIPQAEAERLNELVGPAAVLLGCKADSATLDKEAAKLNANALLVREVGKEVAAALLQDPEEFRTWEQVNHVSLLLAPFNVESGLLTQTLKVKRLSVQERYREAIEKLYALSRSS